MRRFKWLYIVCLSIIFTACTTNFEQYEDDLFTIDVPVGMVDMQGLNNDASLQYGYPLDSVSEDLEPAKEQYLIVMLETKEEIASYGLDADFDALKYSEVSMEALQYNLEDFEIVSEKPEILDRNGMQFVEIEMQGSVGDLSVFYKLAVYEGENAFYQILAWCNLEDKDQFLPDMNRSIQSFKEN